MQFPLLSATREKLGQSRERLRQMATTIKASTSNIFFWAVLVNIKSRSNIWLRSKSCRRLAAVVSIFEARVSSLLFGFLPGTPEGSHFWINRFIGVARDMSIKCRLCCCLLHYSLGAFFFVNSICVAVSDLNFLLISIFSSPSMTPNQDLLIYFSS